MSKLAIHGGPKVRTKPFHKWPVVSEKDVEAVASVVRSGEWGRLDSHHNWTHQFEQKFAHYHDCKYGLCLANGTAALEVAMVAAGISIGDEVIVPPYTFMATATACLQIGAIPIFADIDPETYNIDPRAIESAVTPRTRAIIPVHFGGLPCDMEAINVIAKKYNLIVIEDSAHAHGGIHKNGKLGSLGDVAEFSFQMSKNLSSGEGGCITTNNPDLYNKCILYHDFWRGALRRETDSHFLPDRVNFPVLSWNYRMTEFCGALLLSQFDHLEDWARRRAENAAYLTRRLSQIAGIRSVRTDDFVARNAVHLYLFKFIEGEAFQGISRMQFLKALLAEGIPVFEGYLGPVYKHPIFQEALTGSLRKGFPLTSEFCDRKIDYRKVHCPEAERLCREETVWISQSPFLGTTQDMDDIADAILKIQKHADELRPSVAASERAVV